MNFLYGLITFLIGLIVIVAFLPMFNELISLVPYTGIVISMLGVMVLLIVVGLIYRLYVDTVYYQGGL